MLMEHNIPVYEKFEAMLEEHGKVILITATGTGKSYVTLEYLERHDLRALVLAPRLAICDNWKELSDKIDTVHTDEPSKFVNWGAKKPHIFTVDRKQSVVIYEDTNVQLEI